MERRNIVRNPLPFPEWSELHPAMRRRIERLEQQSQFAAAAAKESQIAAIRSGLGMSRWNDNAADLRHPLSDRWIERRNGSHIRDHRCPRTELDNYLLHRAALVRALRSDGTECLRQASRALCAEARGEAEADCRLTPMGMEADADGTVVLFGRWEDVPMRLAQLQHHFRASVLPPAMKAVAVLAIFLNIHPFADANGRCARALFNAALESAGRSPFAYVPLRIVFDVSLGGFEIRLREAETHGNWSPLVDYFIAVFGNQLRLCEEENSAPA